MDANMHFDNNKIKGLYVKVKGKDARALDKALKKFKRIIKDSGIMLELREREYFEKPSVKKRRKKQLANQRYKNKECYE